MEKIHILLFYKYVKIENPMEFSKLHLSFCNEIGLKGRILVAEEGINGSVSGSKEQTDYYIKMMHGDKRFSDIVFKEDLGLAHPFKKMQVKLKNEIVRFGQNVDLKNTGENLTPEEFIEFIKKDDVIVLDARNDYESKVGKFKGAITPAIKTFREFPKVLDELKGKEDKKIAMYCTGGIRCEKASAFLKENGFKNVYQLKGGILTFAKEYPDTVWEGTCFVFDKRLTSKVNSGDDAISGCDVCGVVCDLYRNCKQLDCNRLFVSCIECEQKLGGCCSQDCLKKMLARNNHLAVAAS